MTLLCQIGHYLDPVKQLVLNDAGIVILDDMAESVWNPHSF